VTTKVHKRGQRVDIFVVTALLYWFETMRSHTIAEITAPGLLAHIEYPFQEALHLFTDCLNQVGLFS
jgi:hypothetical protein